MSIIRVGNLFYIYELIKMEPPHRYIDIFSAIELDSPLWIIDTKTSRGVPIKLNYGAMINTLIGRMVKRIPTIKLLVKFLKKNLFSDLTAGFSCPTDLPSEASYSQTIATISETHMRRQKSKLFCAACDQGRYHLKRISSDRTSHFEACYVDRENKKADTPRLRQTQHTVYGFFRLKFSILLHDYLPTLIKDEPARHQFWQSM